MAEHTGDHAHDEHHGPHHGPKHYIKIWAWLVVLLIISVIGPELGIKWLTMITAFGIAIVKAYMVAAYFMHLNVEKKYITYLLVTCLAFLALFWGGVAPDVMKHDGRNWVNDAAKATVIQGLEEMKKAGDHH